jgi:cyclohexanone monooxygenase
MTCSPTQVPAADEIDVEALRKRYAFERDRRLRPDAGDQYLKTERDYAQTFEADPHMPVTPRDPISEDLDVAVLGGGFSGVMTGVHLRNSGVSKPCVILRSQRRK